MMSLIRCVLPIMKACDAWRLLFTYIEISVYCREATNLLAAEILNIGC